MGVLYGLAAAFCWGIADFLVARVTHRLGIWRALVAIQGFGLLSVALLLFAQRGGVPTVAPHVWMSMLTIALSNFIATLLFYRAFEIGTLSAGLTNCFEFRRGHGHIVTDRW